MWFYDYATLRKIREAQGKTLRDVCQKDVLDMTQHSLRSWEIGKAAPRADHLAILATAYDVDVKDFFRKK